MELRDRAPPNTAYAVVPRGIDAVAWCRDTTVVLAALRHFKPVFCEVIRLEDNCTVWPWLTEGGIA